MKRREAESLAHVMRILCLLCSYCASMCPIMFACEPWPTSISLRDEDCCFSSRIEHDKYLMSKWCRSHNHQVTHPSKCLSMISSFSRQHITRVCCWTHIRQRKMHLKMFYIYILEILKDLFNSIQLFPSKNMNNVMWITCKRMEIVIPNGKTPSVQAVGRTVI